MVTGVDELQKFNKDGLDTAMKSFGTLSKGMQAIAVEVADYSKKSYEDGSAALEKLMGVKSLDKAFEVQTEYMKSAYEGMVSEMSKLGEMYVDLAKDAYKPIEGIIAKATSK
jgi:phasin family protein